MYAGVFPFIATTSFRNQDRVAPWLHMGIVQVVGGIGQRRSLRPWQHVTVPLLRPAEVQAMAKASQP